MSNGRLAFSGSLLRQELNPVAIKAANVCFVIGASAPPAIANSAAPDRTMSAASATASNPAGQAEETVAACVPAPILSAMAFAAACGVKAPTAVGDIPFPPRRTESLND